MHTGVSAGRVGEDVAVSVSWNAACRLREPEKGERRRFSMIGYKYRYTGRTQYQTQQAADQISRSSQSVNRVAGDRFTYDRTLDPGIASSLYLFIGLILWGHSGPLCHALSLSLSLSWTSMRRRRATRQ